MIFSPGNLLIYCLDGRRGVEVLRTQAPAVFVSGEDLVGLGYLRWASGGGGDDGWEDEEVGTHVCC